MVISARHGAMMVIWEDVRPSLIFESNLMSGNDLTIPNQCFLFNFSFYVTASCQDVSGCGACVDRLGISARLELIAGRTFANSGYPSQNAKQCFEIASIDVIGGSDICREAPIEQSPTQVPLVTTAPSKSPVVTVSPTRKPIQLPTLAPVPAPTGTPTVSPVEQTNPPTIAPVEATAKPISLITAFPTPDPVPQPTPPLSYQQCLSSAAIEVRIGAQSGGNGVVCDCTDAETGETNRPKCYTSADRNESSQCGTLHQACATDQDCCSPGIRSCRGFRCRPSARSAETNRSRLSGSLGGAARQDRRNDKQFP